MGQAAVILGIASVTNTLTYMGDSTVTGDRNYAKDIITLPDSKAKGVQRRS